MTAKKSRLSVRLDAETAAMLDRLAERAGKTRGEVICSLIRAAAEKEGVAA